MDIHAKLADRCCENAPAVAARIFEQHEDAAPVAFLEARQPQLIANILKESLPLTGARYLAALKPGLASNTIRAMAFEDAVRLLRHLEIEKRDPLLASLGDDATSYRKVLGYPKGTAGAMMNPHVVVLPGDITLAEAIRRVRRLGEHAYAPYVVDREQRLIGIITVHGVMGNSPRRRVDEVMQSKVVSVKAYSTGIELARISSTASSESVPVTDPDGVLLGVLRPAAVSQLIAEVRKREIPKGYDTTVGSTLGGVFLDTMLRLTAVIMLAGVRPIEKQAAKGGPHG